MTDTWKCVLSHTRDPDRPRTASHGHLCEGHYLSFEQNLAELPALAEEVERTLIRSNGSGPKITGDPERALPFDERASNALHDARGLLASWCRLILDEHPSGLHAPSAAIPGLSAFLLTHLDWIATQDWVDDLHGEFGDLRHGLLAARTTSHTRVVPLGPCGQTVACDVATHADVCCEGTLRAFLSQDSVDPRPVVCSACGTEHQPEAWRTLARRLRKDAEPMLTYAQISQLLVVPIGTLKRWKSEDEWRALDTRPLRLHLEDAQRSFDTRRLEVAS